MACRVIAPSLQQTIRACVLSCIVAIGAITAAEAQVKRVLFLHSFGQEFRPWSSYIKNTRSELTKASPWPLDITEHSFVAARTADEATEAPFVAYLASLFARSAPDLIVTFGAPAAGFVQRNRQRLFLDIPLMMAAVSDQRVDYSKMTGHDVVLAVKQFPAVLIDHILRILPDTRTVAIVNGDSPAERSWGEEIRRDLAPFDGRVTFEWLDKKSYDETLKRAANLPPHSAILWIQMFIDAAGVVHEGDEAIRKLNAVANAPIFSHDDGFFGWGIIGGPMHSAVTGGRQAAAAAVRLLAGEPPSAIQTAARDYDPPKYDARELRRWGISESRLPAGSDVQFREPSPWEEHRRAILLTLFLLLLQGAIIAWLVRERMQRFQSEAAARNLSGRLISAHEEERSRLARELHDDVTQRLAALAIDAACERAKTRHESAVVLETMRKNLVRLSDDVHSLSYRLHPSILEELGLVEAIHTEIERVERATRISIRLSAPEIPTKLPRDVALSLFRVVQEAFRNIVRHSGATRVDVELMAAGKGVRLSIRDNGEGFDLAARRARASLGLASMRERVHFLGGTIDIESSRGLGTTVRAWVPLPP